MLNEYLIDYNCLIINDIIKKGKYSTIHRGSYLNNQVAIKMLISHNSNDQSKTLFQNEINILSLTFIKHFNILE